MDSYFLDVKDKPIGGYLSSEQMDLLSIIQCKDKRELEVFVKGCYQFTNIDVLSLIKDIDDIEEAKKEVFKAYQDSMVYHDSSYMDNVKKRLELIGINTSNSDINKIVDYDTLINYVKKNFPDKAREILKLNNRVFSLERDQLKDEDLYSEFEFLNSNLDKFDTILVGSGKIYNIINPLFDKDDKDRYDFSIPKRDIDFARKNGKKVRYHSLLVRENHGRLLEGKSKEEIKEILSGYVEKSMDFVNENSDVIKEVDIFNEIVTFDKMVEYKGSWLTINEFREDLMKDFQDGKISKEQGYNMYDDLSKKAEYKNMWEIKYGLSIDELVEVFEPAVKKKPKGINYVYNEPFLEDSERRKVVFDVLRDIRKKSPEMIDTLGSQMHITLDTKLDSIRDSFKDFSELKKEGIGVQITEFDLSVPLSRYRDMYLKGGTTDDFYDEKDNKIREISNIIKESDCDLKSISYWSLTDTIDHNLERSRSNIKGEGMKLDTMCSGVFPTRRSMFRDKHISKEHNNTYKKVLYKSNGNKQGYINIVWFGLVIIIVLVLLFAFVKYY